MLGDFFKKILRPIGPIPRPTHTPPENHPQSYKQATKKGPLRGAFEAFSMNLRPPTNPPAAMAVGFGAIKPRILAYQF